MSDPGTTAAAPATTAAPAATTTPAATAPAAFDWNTVGLDADTNTYVAGKGWKAVPDVINSYRNAEKLLSVPADQVIKLPQGEFNQENWNTQVADRLGRPKDPAGYELAKLVPEGADPKFAEAAAVVFHKQGVTARQAQELTKWWNEHVAGATSASAAAVKTKHDAEVSTLKAEWGQNFDANSHLVDKAAETFGMDADFVAALKTAAGPAKAMKFLHAIGQKMGVSDQFISGDGRQTTFAGGMTPDQAKAEIDTLRKDNAFIAKYTAGDADAKARMNRLHQMAFPGQ